MVKFAIPSEFETVPEISKPVPVLWLYISRLPAFVTVPEIFNRPAVFEISALPSLVTVPEMSKPLEPALDISSSLILLTEPAIVNPEPLLVIVIFWLELSPMTLPEPETRNLPALFVIVADPFELCTVPSMLKPLLPELVISNVVPEFETVPLMSNILFVLSRSADPALLVTEPSIVKPPSPEFVIVILVPSFCTSPPVSTFKPPAALSIFPMPRLLRTLPAIFKPLSPELLISSVAPELVTVPFISNILLVLVKSASPFELVTVPSIVNPASPLLFIASRSPAFSTRPPVCTFKPPV